MPKTDDTDTAREGIRGIGTTVFFPPSLGSPDPDPDPSPDVPVPVPPGYFIAARDPYPTHLKVLYVVGVLLRISLWAAPLHVPSRSWLWFWRSPYLKVRR